MRAILVSVAKRHVFPKKLSEEANSVARPLLRGTISDSLQLPFPRPFRHALVRPASSCKRGIMDDSILTVMPTELETGSGAQDIDLS